MDRPNPNTTRTPLPKADKYIWAIFIALIAISVVELYSASSREVSGSNILLPLLRHGRLLLLGVLITWGVSRMDYRWLIPLTPIIVIFSICIGFYVLFRGEIINGARRSTTLLGIPLQSAELLKFSVVLIVAFVLSRCQEKGGVKTSGVAATAVAVLVCCGILFSQGLTNTLLLLGIFFTMMLIAGVQMRKVIAVFVAFGILGGAFVMLKGDDDETPQYTAAEQAYITEHGTDFSGHRATIDRSSTQKGRIARWLGIGDTVPKYQQPITALNRQEQYSYMAQANGGWHGRLPGNSRETARLPLAFSDYIFAIVVEDWGLIGGIGLLILYLCLLGRAGAVASRCDRAFPAFLVMGMAVMIVLQALFHIAIVTGVFPVSGQPLPLISKGGSSILVTCLAFGIMLSVSRYADQTSSRHSESSNAPSSVLPEQMAARNPLKN